MLANKITILRQVKNAVMTTAKLRNTLVSTFSYLLGSKLFALAKTKKTNKLAAPITPGPIKMLSFGPNPSASPLKLKCIGIIDGKLG